MNGVHSASWVQTIEELLERNSSGSDLETREYGRTDPLRWPRDTLYPQNLALASPTSGGRSVGIVRSRTKATEFELSLCMYVYMYGWMYGLIMALQTSMLVVKQTKYYMRSVQS
jgi:hypothetical protein